MQTTQNIPQQPLITFIVTIYNLPIKLIHECLDSIISLSLSKEQREIIVIDDGSDISQVNELVRYASDIIYVRQPNQGVSVARNLGIKIASGTFIQFIDGDDCLIQAEYEHCLDIIRYHEPVDMVLFYLSQSKKSPMDVYYEGPMTGVDYMENNNVRGSVCSYVFRAERLGDLHFTPGIVHGEDEEFTPQLLLRVRNLYTTQAKAYFYRNRNDSVSHKKSKQNIDDRINDTLKVILSLKNVASNNKDEKEREAINRRVAQLSMDYIVNVIRLTRSFKRLHENINLLTEHQLYPLPNKTYTKKYVIFNKLIRSKVGRFILMALL